MKIIKMSVIILIMALISSCTSQSREGEEDLESGTDSTRTVIRSNMPKQSPEELRTRLSSLQYEVTQNGGTEQAFANIYDKNYEEGIYVDIIDGTPLFSSTTKFDSGTGWPSFTSPISSQNIEEKEDNILFYSRTEILGAKSGSHIGHVFEDGPKESGGLRYCLNSASLAFIPKLEMKERGYESYLSLF